MMKILSALVLVLILIIPFSGCEHKDNDGFQYPLNIGNHWMYSQEFYFYNTSVGHMDTIINSCEVWIERTLAAPSGVLTYELKYRYDDYPVNSYSYQYVANLADGFYELGRKGAGSIAPTKNTTQNNNLLFPKNVSGNFTKDEEWLDIPIRLAPYDFEIGDEWNYPGSSYQSPFYTIVLPAADVELASGLIHCNVLKNTYFLDDFSWEVQKSYSKQGMAMMYNEGIDEITDENGNSIGTFPHHTTWKMIQADLH